MTRVYIGIGSNVGWRIRHIQRGMLLLSERGFSILRRSRIYETEPVGMAGAGRFLNLVVSAETRVSSRACLDRLLEVEQALGRPRHSRNEPRTLDLDLLFYGHQVIRQSGLCVPHPRLHERAFVLAPFCDIAPGFVHPILRRKLSTLLNGLDTRGIRLWSKN